MVASRAASYGRACAKSRAAESRVANGSLAKRELMTREPSTSTGANTGPSARKTESREADRNRSGAGTGSKKKGRGPRGTKRVAFGYRQTGQETRPGQLRTREGLPNSRSQYTRILQPFEAPFCPNESKREREGPSGGNKGVTMRARER